MSGLLARLNYLGQAERSRSYVKVHSHGMKTKTAAVARMDDHGCKADLNWKL